MSDPDTVDGWLRLAAQHEASARARPEKNQPGAQPVIHAALALEGALAEIKQTGAQAVFHAGLAVECALKAYIMRSERLNGWPSRDSRPELYTHDIRELRPDIRARAEPQVSAGSRLAHLFAMGSRAGV